MTRDKTKALMPEMQAFVEGKDIEKRHIRSNDWIITEDPEWNNPNYKFRVAVKPDEVWVVRERNCKGKVVFLSKSDAEKWISQTQFPAYYKLVAYREVL